MAIKNVVGQTAVLGVGLTDKSKTIHQLKTVVKNDQDRGLVAGQTECGMDGWFKTPDEVERVWLDVCDGCQETSK